MKYFALAIITLLSSTSSILISNASAAPAKPSTHAAKPTASKSVAKSNTTVNHISSKPDHLVAKEELVEVHNKLVQAYVSKNLEAVMSFFDPDVKYVSSTGEIIEERSPFQMIQSDIKFDMTEKPQVLRISFSINSLSVTGGKTVLDINYFQDRQLQKAGGRREILYKRFRETWFKMKGGGWKISQVGFLVGGFSHGKALPYSEDIWKLVASSGTMPLSELEPKLVKLIAEQQTLQKQFDEQIAKFQQKDTPLPPIDDKQSIIGKWEEIGENLKVEFFKGGSASMVSRTKMIGSTYWTDSGGYDYSWVDDRHLRLSSPQGIIIVEVGMFQGHLLLKQAAGALDVFKRVK